VSGGAARYLEQSGITLVDGDDVLRTGTWELSDGAAMLLRGVMKNQKSNGVALRLMVAFKRRLN
jgi:hypothetical protein